MEISSLFNVDFIMPLEKISNNSNNILIPKISFRFNPSDMKNYSSSENQIDTGNVFAQDCGDDGNINCSEFDVGELRYSYGLGVTWITQLGPMSLALAATGNAGPLDRTEGFQFEIGTQF